MKRALIALLILAAVGFTAYKLFGNKEERKTNDPELKPLTVHENSDAFNQSFGVLINTYYRLKDAFVQGDTVRADQASASLAVMADSLKVDEIKGDSTGTIRELAKNYAGTIKGSALGLQGEQDITAKRREFQMISGTLWDLTRAVRYDGQKIYKLFCPMAFDNTGAEWLSNSDEVNNPYMGAKMPHCGEVRDSLDYAGK